MPTLAMLQRMQFHAVVSRHALAASLQFIHIQGRHGGALELGLQWQEERGGEERGRGRSFSTDPKSENDI